MCAILPSQTAGQSDPSGNGLMRDPEDKEHLIIDPNKAYDTTGTRLLPLMYIHMDANRTL